MSGADGSPRGSEGGAQRAEVGRMKFRSDRDHPNALYLAPVRRRRTSAERRKARAKSRLYLRTPSDWYSYRPDEPRDVTSSYIREGTGTRLSLNEQLLYRRQRDHEPQRKPALNKLFAPGNKRNPRKAMIVGERPPLGRFEPPRREPLPGNLFLDNLRRQDIDWRKFNRVTWDDILHSHQIDVSRIRDHAQPSPRRDDWLARIDKRDADKRFRENRELPRVSPRIFNKHVTPKKELSSRYVSKNKNGDVVYIVGPGDVTHREYRHQLQPEPYKNPPTPKKLNF